MAGILDYLFSGGQSAGILSGGGPQILQPQYQPSPWDTQPLPNGQMPQQPPMPTQPMPTQPMPAQAMPTQPQMHQPSPFQNFMGALGSQATLGYLGGALQGGNVGQSIARGLQGYQTGMEADRARQGEQAIAQYVGQQPGLDPMLRAAIARNPQLAAAFIAAKLKPNEYKFENVNGTFGAFDPRTGKFAPQGAVPQFQKVGPGEQGSFITPGLPGSTSGPSVVPAISGGPEKPPAGYEYVDPKDPSQGLKAIAGGPATHLPSETAGRIAMMETAARELGNARRVLMEGRGALGAGVVGSVQSTLGLGEVGRAQRSVKVAIEGALRAMTGAAAPETEVKRYAEMFSPSPADNRETAKQKLDLLEGFISNARSLVTQGRTATPGGAAPTAPQGKSTPTDPLGIR